MIEGIRQTAEYWRAGGPLLAPIGLTCFAIWLCFVRSRNLLARSLREGHAVEATLDRARPGPGGAARLRTGIATAQGGVAAMIRLALEDIRTGTPAMEAFTTRQEECLRWLRRDFVLLAALTAVAPLLGLLGTVRGMIQTFDAVSVVSGNTGSRVAAGISRALITTQFGLVVALPGVFGLARLRRMLEGVEVLMADCRAHAVYLLKGGSGGSES